MNTFLALAQHSLSDQVADHFERRIGRSDLERVHIDTAQELVAELRNHPERHEFAVLPQGCAQDGECAISLVLDLLKARPELEIVSCVPAISPLYLWGVPGSTLRQVTTVCCPIEALCACRDALKRFGIMRADYDVSDTAAAAKEVAARGRRDLAAIAPRKAGAAHGLVPLLEESVDAGSPMSFYVLGREPVSFASAYNRTMVAIQNHPEIVTRVFRSAEDLERVCTLHTDGEEWLALRLRGDMQTGTVRRQVKEIEAAAAPDFRFLGSYWVCDPVHV